MWNKIGIWWAALDNGWKVFLTIIAFVSGISTVAVKVNKGVELMAETAVNVKLLMKSDTIQSKSIREIEKNIFTYSSKQNAQAESYVDHLKLEKRLDEVIRFYERMARAENEKKNLSPIP